MEEAGGGQGVTVLRPSDHYPWGKDEGIPGRHHQTPRYLPAERSGILTQNNSLESPGKFEMSGTEKSGASLLHKKPKEQHFSSSVLSGTVESSNVEEEDWILRDIGNREYEIDTYTSGLDTLLESLVIGKDFKKQQAEIQKDFLSDMVKQQQQRLQCSASQLQEKLEGINEKAARMASTVRQLEREKHHMEEARDIVRSILQLRALKEKLTVALDRQELTSATEAACEVQHIRHFFSSIDSKYASGGSSTSSPSSSSLPGLSVVEAQVLQQLQQLQLRLLHLLFQKWTSIGLEGLREQQQRREEERQKRHQNQEGGERGENEKYQGGQINDQRDDGENMRGTDDSCDPSGKNARLGWKQDLVHTFSLLKTLNKQQDALKRYVDQMNGHLADVGVKTFKVLVQLRKKQKFEQNEEAYQRPQRHSLLHSAALAQLLGSAEGLLRAHVKAIERAAGTAKALPTLSSFPRGESSRVTGDDSYDVKDGRRKEGPAKTSACGEAEAAGLYGVVGLRQELEIQCMRILNHFSDTNEDILLMKTAGACAETDERETAASTTTASSSSSMSLKSQQPSNRANNSALTSNSTRLRLDYVLSELASLSALCIRIHRKFKRAASHRIRRSSSLLLLLQSASSSSSSSSSSSKTSQETSHQRKASSECRKISNEDIQSPPSTARERRGESSQNFGSGRIAQGGREKKNVATTSGHSLVDLIRQYPVYLDASFQSSSLMRGREELMAHYVTLENACIIGSVDQALNVADEISFSFPSSSSSAVSSYFSSSSFYDTSSSHTQRDVCDPLLISGGGGGAGVEAEDEDDDRYYSTVVDDIFFILNKSVSRAIDSLDVLAVCAIINNICNLLSSDVKNKLRKNLEESKGFYSNYIKVETHARNYSLVESLPQEVLQRASPQDGTSSRLESLSSSYSWTHSVNNVSLAVSTLKKFKDRVTRDFTNTFAHTSPASSSKRRKKKKKRFQAEEVEAQERGRRENSDLASHGGMDDDPYDPRKTRKTSREEEMEHLGHANDREEEEEGDGCDSGRDEEEEGSDDEDEDWSEDDEEEESSLREKMVDGQGQEAEAKRKPESKKKDTDQNKNNLMMFEYTLQAVDGVVEEFQALHERCCKITLKFLQVYLHKGLDSLHDVVFELHGEGGGENDNLLTSSSAHPSTDMSRKEESMSGGYASGDYLGFDVQERWRLELQRGLGILLNHLGKEYDRPTQNLCCSLLFQVLASKMETLLLDKSYTALGGLQLSSQLRRFLQKLSLLHHSYYSAANETSFFPPLSGRNQSYEDAASSSAVASHSSSSSSSGRNFLGALAAAASGGAGGRGLPRGGGGEEEDGEDILSTVKILCDTPIRPKFGRLLEMTELLSLGTLDELLDIFGPSSGKFWKLSVHEMKKVLEKRIDFSRQDIDMFFASHQLE
ncbi:cog4 transport protein [Cystoisospora suis]|uniref:Conserved oligomeric Golgi complex subunit 4 n=1 Tax=Cystoisospora suis TaxID=483139 RepID=A0A2C6KTJ4_9APIC|nr:cog4 transport protein [Cystoisospora suis]